MRMLLLKNISTFIFWCSVALDYLSFHREIRKFTLFTLHLWRCVLILFWWQ
jgi:hypothetical protein